MDIEFGRRSFLRVSGGATIAAGLAGTLTACGGESGVTADALPKVKLGFIALTDCAPLVIAKEQGFFKEKGLDVELIKQANWAATRDNLLNGQIDGAHCLFSMPLSVAAGVAGAGTTDLKIAMVLSNNGQAITLKKEFASAGYNDLAKAKALLDGKPTTLAMTFPGGTHDVWLRYWLKATGADTSKAKIITIPPPQMVQNMTVGNMEGYCVGEPWGAVAVQKGIGFTTIATQDIWDNHPEKALVVGKTFAADAKLEKVVAAILKAQKWLDDPGNRVKAAEIIGAPGYVSAPAKEIEGRLTGKYELGAGLPAKDFAGHQMQFFREGETPFPRKAHGLWFLAQYKRFGLIPAEADYTKIVDAIFLQDLYTKVAKAEGVSVPDDDMKPFKVQLDDSEFDPANPSKEAVRA
ncbi:CmpA/NrtA family ABC transporter substrate-binding protein [Actinocorallia longicatena]|uniref:CmpA/NrtA family ABC transporter substrate-binding protein n=1 Tax=Actinocorallia longicatena TaxID=111803 RepID=A0ABP6Q735_9ACTN